MRSTLSKKRLSFLSLAAMVGLVAASVCGTAHAVEVWYDGFTTTDMGGDYIVGESGTPDLGGQSGGSGSFFAGAWAAAGYPASPPDNTKVFSANLSRPGMLYPSTGGSTSNTAHFGGCCYESRTSRLMASPWAGPTNPDATYYVGYLVDYGIAPNPADPHHRVLEMHEGGFDDGLNRNLLLGFSSFVFPDGQKENMQLRVRDSNTNVETTVELAEQANMDDVTRQGTHWMVLKFELSNSGNDVVSAFLDPVGNTEPASSASISVGEFLADRISTLVQFTYQGGDQNGYFDEIRVGTEWADVALNRRPFAGVPEPGTICLLGLGIACLGSTVRRKRA